MLDFFNKAVNKLITAILVSNYFSLHADVGVRIAAYEKALKRLSEKEGVRRD